MSEPRICPNCDKEIPEDSSAGVCPYCALQAGMYGAEATPAISGARPRIMPPEEVAPHFPELEGLQLIGPGGMATVYRARQRELDRPVALKVVHAHLAADPWFADRFAREARTLARLDHPNIVRVYDGGHRGAIAYLIMELVDGGTLRQAMSAGRLTSRETLGMVSPICAALQYAHDQGVVHRDVKPENILLDSDGSPKVADFGLAKLVGGVEAHLTVAGDVMGTPHYMAPEQIANSLEVDQRADIFALGVVIYEMLTGELPVGRFPPPSAKAAIDQRLDSVVLRALEREPDARYQRASELQSDLEALSTPAPGGSTGGAPEVSTEPSGEAQWTAAPPSADRRFAAGLLLVAASAVVALVVALLIYQRMTATPSTPSARSTPAAPPLTSIAVLPFADMSPEGDQEWLANGMAEELIESLARFQQLRVIARTSAFALRGETAATIGERLAVGSVVEGSVRRSGDELRITAQLVRAADGANAWSARYDRKLDDVFGLQTEIARDVAEAIRAELGLDEEALYGDLSVGRYSPRDVRAYELLRKGIELGTFALTEEALRQGNDYYAEALEIDPEYADAHGMLGMHHALLWIIGYDPTAERRASAKAAAERALELDDTNSTAQQVLALLDIHEAEFGAAQQRLERALAMHPRAGGLRMRYAEVLAQVGRLDEAVTNAREAVRLDPLAPVRHFELGGIYLLAGRFGDAVESLEYALELNPRQLGATTYLSSAYHFNGMDREALETAVRDLPERSKGLEGPMREGFARDGYRGMVAAMNGALVQVTGNPCGFSPAMSAHFYAVTGDSQPMYGCLEKVVASSRISGLYLKVHPVWEPYRAEERFQELLRRVGLD